MCGHVPICVHRFLFFYSSLFQMFVSILGSGFLPGVLSHSRYLELITHHSYVTQCVVCMTYFVLSIVFLLFVRVCFYVLCVPNFF